MDQPGDLAPGDDRAPLAEAPSWPHDPPRERWWWWDSVPIIIVRGLVGALLTLAAILGAWYLLAELGLWIGGPVGDAIGMGATVALFGIGAIASGLRIGRWVRWFAPKGDRGPHGKPWTPKPPKDRGAE